MRMWYPALSLAHVVVPLRSHVRVAIASKCCTPKMWCTSHPTRTCCWPLASSACAQEFLAAGNIADYLGFTPVEAVHLPVPVTLVFVGFQVRAAGLPVCHRCSREHAADV